MQYFTINMSRFSTNSFYFSFLLFSGKLLSYMNNIDFKSSDLGLYNVISDFFFFFSAFNSLLYIFPLLNSLTCLCIFTWNNLCVCVCLCARNCLYVFCIYLFSKYLLYWNIDCFCLFFFNYILNVRKFLNIFTLPLKVFIFRILRFL